MSERGALSVSARPAAPLRLTLNGDYDIAMAEFGSADFATTYTTPRLTATVGAGNLALSAGAGTASMTGGVSASLNSGVIASIGAPVTKIGLSTVGCVVAGVPGPPSPAFDYVTGLPLLGQATVLVGP